MNLREWKRQEKTRILQEHDTKVNDIFVLWQNLFERKRSSLTKIRRWHISLALDKFTSDKIELVLQTAAGDPNTRGQNKLNRPFDDLDNILRNEERIEMYLKMAELKGIMLVPIGRPVEGERI